MNTAERQIDIPQELAYHLLRNALERFGRNPDRLDPEQYRQARHKAERSYELESLVLASDEADGLTIHDGMLDRSVAAVAARYESPEEFEQDLSMNGLDREGLRQALRRELTFDGVMQRVAAHTPAVNDLDIRLFYEMHHDRFSTPERRVASHILITVNPEFAENTRGAALARMELIVEKLGGRANRFHEFARRWSECPTALEGGKLGELQRGQLYTELDAMLFKMEEGRISSIVETELGFHILLCEKILRGKRVPLSKAKPRVRELLQERNRRNCQKAWIAGLRKVQEAGASTG